jgi:hypothetical protein
VRSPPEIVVNVGDVKFDSGHFVTEGEWEKVGLRVDGGNFEVIINGAVVTGGSTPVGTAPTYDSRVLIGARTDSALPETEEGFFFNGGIDEVYFRSSFVSDDELSAEYTNINSPATFYTLGAVETEVISGAVALTDKSSSIGAGGGLLITGQAAAEEEPASIMIGAEMLISMNAALQDDAAQIAGLIDVLNEASASITITDEGASFSAVGGTYISGDFVVTDSDSTVSLDTSMIMGMNAALQVNPESVQLFSDVIISATIALADNPTALFIEELAISSKLRIIVTGARIGNTITLTGKKVARTLTVDA